MDAVDRVGTAAMAAVQLAVKPGSRAVANLPSAALVSHLRPRAATDPLGLGVERPAAPTDPDEYDVRVENEEFARALLSPEERAAIDEEVARDGHLTIAQVRSLVADNSVKFSVEAGGIDAETMAAIDARVNYKIFVAGDNLYTREELYDHFPFHEFNTQPEAVFAQQELGIFPRRAGEPEIVARDVGDTSVEFARTEDLVGQAVGRGAPRTEGCPPRVVKTKIYVGRELWEDFLALQRFYRGAARVAAAQIAYEAAGGPKRSTEQRLLRAESALAEREQSLGRLERSVEEMQRRLDEKIRRLDGVLGAAGLPDSTSGE